MNSKVIGNSYEREFCKVISEWLTREKDALVCWRKVDSGSIGTFRKKKNLEDKGSGDITALDDPDSQKYLPFFQKYYVDTKSYGKIDWNFLKNGKSNDLLNQWKKTVSESNTRIPIMPVKVRDRKTPELIFVPTSSPEWYTGLNHVAFNSTDFPSFVIIFQEEFLNKKIWNIENSTIFISGI